MTRASKATALFCVLFLGSLLFGADRRTDTAHLTIMSFNAEFLWDGKAPEDGSSQVQFPWKGSPVEAAEHMEEIAGVIIQANPDIVALIELEGQPALEQLNNDFLAGRGYVPYFIQGKDTFTGQDIGLLTRIDPVGDKVDRTDLAGESGGVMKSVSKNLFASFDANGIRFTLIALHFLANPNSESRRLDREAQADAIRQLAAAQRAAGAEIVVLGDFNDYDPDDDSRDHNDSMPISNVLRIIKGMGTFSTDDDLVNVARFIPKATRFTSHFDQDDDDHVDEPHELTSIDHILISQPLAEKVDFAAIPHEHDPTEVSDHFPVVVRFAFAGAASTDGVRVTRLLPNPDGNEETNEEVTLKNFGSGAVSLVGWKLRDRANTTWTLDAVGSLAPGAEHVVSRNGQQMAMNNRGDTVDLINASDVVVQSVTYGPVEEGEEVLPHID